MRLFSLTGILQNLIDMYSLTQSHDFECNTNIFSLKKKEYKKAIILNVIQHIFIEKKNIKL